MVTQTCFLVSTVIGNFLVVMGHVGEGGEEVLTFPDVDRFKRREHMCLGFETDHNLFQCGGINGHAWAGRYIDPLRICQVNKESKLTVNINSLMILL